MTKTEFIRELGFTTAATTAADLDRYDIGPAAEKNGVVIELAASGQSSYVAILHRGYVIYLEDYVADWASVSTDDSIGVTNDEIMSLGEKLNGRMADADPAQSVELAVVLYDEKSGEAAESSFTVDCSAGISFLVSDEAKEIYDQIIASAEKGGHTVVEGVGMSLREMGELAKHERFI